MLLARIDVVALHAFITLEEAMTATTDHYLGIDVHKREAQVDVLIDENAVIEDIRIANADLDGIAEKYTESRAAIEAGSNYCILYDRLDKDLDVILANRANQASFVTGQNLIVVGIRKENSKFPSAERIVVWLKVTIPFERKEKTISDVCMLIGLKK